MASDLEKLEAVFYSAPVPLSGRIVTFLGLVFDRVHFPNVYIPTVGFDPDEVVKEIERIKAVPKLRPQDHLLLSVMHFALMPELREFLHFAGAKGQLFGGELNAAGELAASLQQLIHGPPPPNFYPTFETGYTKGISQEESIDYPGDYFYQANALRYAASHHIPLLNDMPGLPVPSLATETPENNAKLLAAFMAIECANLVLPEVAVLRPQQIIEARAELAPHVKPFRLALLGLANELNGAIDNSMTEAEIHKAAKFIAETKVYPPLRELQDAIAKPRAGWKGRSWDLSKVAVELAIAHATLGPVAAVAKVIKALGDWIKQGNANDPKRSQHYYLVKLGELGSAQK